MSRWRKTEEGHPPPRALTHHRGGRLPEAEGIYRQILAQEPNHAPALQFLGVIAFQTAHHDQALQLIRRAMSLQPEQASYHSNLGMVLAAKGELVDAIAAFSAASITKQSIPSDGIGQLSTIRSLNCAASPSATRLRAARPICES